MPGSGPGGSPTWRPTAGRLLAWLGGAVVVAVLVLAGTWIYLERTGALSRRALALANSYLSHATNLRLTAAKIQRTATGVRLTDPVVEASDSGRWYPQIRCRRADVGVDLVALVLRRPQIFQLRLVEPLLVLPYTPDGRAVLPSFHARGQGHGGPPRDGIGIEMERASFEVQSSGDTTEWWHDGTLRMGLVPARGGYEIALEQGGGALPPLGLVIERAGGRGWTGGDSLGWSDLAAVTDAGTVRLAGGVRGHALDVDFRAAGWPWEFFGDLLEQPALDVPGQVGARGRVTGTLDHPAFHAAVEGQWREEPFRAWLTGDVPREGLALTGARLEWQRASLAGSARFERDGKWWLAGDLADLDLAAVERLWPGVRLPTTDLSGPARLEGGGGRLALSGQGLAGTVGTVRVDGVRGSWEIAGREQSLDISGRVAGGAAEATGTLRGGQVEASVSAEGLDLARLAEVDERLGGLTGTLPGATLRLSGPRERPHLLASGTLEGAAYRGVRLGSAELGAEGDLGPGEALDLSLQGADLSAGVWHADSVVARGTRLDRQWSVPELRASSPDTLVSTAFLAIQTPGGWSVTVPHLWVQAGEWWMEGVTAIALGFEAGGVSVQDAILNGNLGRVELSGRAGGEDVDLRADAEGLDLEAVGAALGAPELSGDLSAQAHLRAGTGWRQLDVDFQSGELLARHTHVLDLTGSASLRAAGGTLSVERLRLAASDGSLTGSAQARLAGKIWPLSPTQWADALRHAREWRGELRATNFDLSLVSGLWPQTVGGAGRWTGLARLGGKPADPEGTTEGTVTGLALGGYHFDAAQWQADFRSGTLTLRRLDIIQGPLRSRIAGTLPLDLAWDTPGAQRLPDRPMDLSLHVPDGDLAVLPLFVPVVAAAEGRVAGDVRLTGTPVHPHATGTARVTEGKVRFTGREEVYHDVRASLRVVDDTVWVDSLDAGQGKAGVLRGSGFVAIGDGHVRDYDLRVSARGASALASGEYAFLFDGSLEVTGGPRVGNSFFPLPHVGGRVDVREGVLLYDFADPNNRVYFAGPEEGPAWVYDIDLSAPGRVYWRTPSANIEMKADLTVSQTLDALRVWGTVDALRGDYYFLENKFRVQSGTLTFDEVEPLNPKIDAKAQTFVNSRPLGGGSVQREEVDIELADRLRKPKVTLSSSVGRSETEIIRLLTYGRFGGGAEALGGGQERVVAGTMGGQYLVRQLAREVPEAASLLRAVDVGTAVVNTETGGRVVPSVGVSHYLTGDFLLRYSQLLGDVQPGGYDFDFRDVGAEYRISKIFYLTGEVVERRAGSVVTPGTSASELDYNVDLRARHEW